MSGAAGATTGAIQWRPPPTRVAYSQYVHDTASCPRTHDRLSLCGSLTKLANVTAHLLLFTSRAVKSLNIFTFPHLQ